MLPHDLLGLLGLAQRAGKVILGATGVSREIGRSRRPLLLIFAVDFSAATKERLLARAPMRPHMIEIGTMQEWGAFFGRQQVGVMAISDKNFIAGILEKVKP